MRRLTLLLGTALAAGCGGAPETEIVTAAQYVTVIDRDGRRASIPSGALIDPQSGGPAVRQVLVIDRQTNRQVWISVADLLEQPPPSARYIPVTSENPGETPAAD